jgi:hypothetical protein
MTKFLTFEAPCPALAGQGASNVSYTKNPPPYAIEYRSENGKDM